MIQAQAPIDSYIISVYKQPDKLKADNALLEKVENLVDIIKSRIISKGIGYTCSSLRDELWDLRWEVVFQQKNLDKVFSAIKEETLTQISISAYNQDHLEIVKAECLSLYTKLLVPVHQNVSKQFTTLSSQDFVNAKNAYGSLKLLYSTTPAAELERTLKWIESSLDFECGLIITRLIFSKDLIVDSITKDEIAKHLKESVISMAFYFAIMGMWRPEDDDEDQYVRNVKILLADYELKHSNQPTFSLSEFQKLFAA
jgi:hypothetical protein